jgi:glycosyltransferase involved in cell wall biosynthesis
MNTIHITTQAYNAEKTLRRTLESVRAQTYQNYKHYVCDNGSTDGTRAIIDEYAEKGLIIPFYNAENMVWNEKSKIFAELQNNIPDDDYFATLDSDDELFPVFFEKLLNFATENNLDVAAANYEQFIVDENHPIVCMPNLTEEKYFICSPEDFESNFMLIFPVFFPVWGKLIRGNVHFDYQKSAVGDGYTSAVGSESLINLDILKKDVRVGVLSEPLMRYYIKPNSYAQRFDQNRKYFRETFFKSLSDLLVNKCGEIKKAQRIDLYIRYCTEATFTLKVALESDISIDEKLDEIDFFFSQNRVRDLYKDIDFFVIFRNNKTHFDIISPVLSWIISHQNEIPEKRLLKSYRLAFDVVYQNKPVKFTDDEIAYMAKADLRFLNSVLCGYYESTENWLSEEKDSNMKKSIAAKITQK